MAILYVPKPLGYDLDRLSFKEKTSKLRTVTGLRVFDVIEFYEMGKRLNEDIHPSWKDDSFNASSFMFLSLESAGMIDNFDVYVGFPVASDLGEKFEAIVFENIATYEAIKIFFEEELKKVTVYIAHNEDEAFAKIFKISASSNKQ